MWRVWKRKSLLCLMTMPSSSPRRAFLTGNTATANSFVCRRLRIPNDPAFVQAVSGALLELTDISRWEQFGTMSPEDSAHQATQMIAEYFESGACMIGTIVPHILAHMPDNMLPCDGSVYNNADYPELAAVIDSSLNVGFSQFRTPDLRGRFVLASGGAYSPHVFGGEEAVELAVEELPAHSHTSPAHSHVQNAHTHSSPGHNHSQPPHTHTYNYPVINIDIEAPGVPDPLALGNPGLPAVTSPASPAIGFTAVTINNATATNQNTAVEIDDTGGNEAHENMPPYYALQYAIIAR